MLQHMNSRFDYLDPVPKATKNKLAGFVALGAVASVLAGSALAAASASAAVGGTTAAAGTATAIAHPM